MNERWRPWQKMLPVWLPAVLLCLGNVFLYGWLSSDSVGRAAQLRDRVVSLEEGIETLHTIDGLATVERRSIVEIETELERIYGDVFGDLDQRLTRILRAVGTATREAGMLPGRFSYSAAEEDGLNAVRFGIQFSVTGQYAQVRKLLAALQASPEFLIVEGISFKGDEESASRELAITVGVATYLAEAERDRLRQLTAGAAGEIDEEGDDGS